MSMEEFEAPLGYYYTEGDTWVRQTVPGIVRIGITDYAQKKLKKIEYLDLPEPETEIEEGTSAGEVESSKSLAEILAPVSGCVVSVNEEAVDEPAVLNRDPYGDGWLLELACPDYEKQTEKLMDAVRYLDYLKNR